MDYLKKHALTTIQYIRALAKWVIVSGLVGLTGGLVGTMFHWAIDVCTDIRIENPWIILFLPIAGLIIVWIYRLEHVVGCGTNTVIESIQSGEKIPAALIPAIFAGSVLTHLAGGSAGREGAALQLGALIACELGAQLWLQIVIFAVVSVAALLLTRPLAAKYINQKSQPTNADRLIGTECIVTECIDNIAATGAVTAQGRPWTARSATGEAIEPGALVVVESIEGAKLIVAPLNKKEATGG